MSAHDHPRRVDENLEALDMDNLQRLKMYEDTNKKEATLHQSQNLLHIFGESQNLIIFFFKLTKSKNLSRTTLNPS